MTNATENAANAARQDNVNPTNVDTHMASSLTSATDVVVYDEYYELYCNIDWAYNAAFTECASLNPADECEQHQIRVNLDAIDALTTAQEKAMMCMEFGHSLGLKHRQVAGSTANGCMDNNHYYQDFTGHDVDHLNSHYN